MPYCQIDVYDHCNDCGNPFIQGEKIDSIQEFADGMMEQPIIAYAHEKCPKTIGKHSEKCPECNSPNKKHADRCHECRYNFTQKCRNCGGEIKRLLSGLAELICEDDRGYHGED